MTATDQAPQAPTIDLASMEPGERELKLNEFRKKAMDGTLTLEEGRAAFAWLRAKRLSTPTVTGGTRTRAKAASKPSINTDDLLDNF